MTYLDNITFFLLPTFIAGAGARLEKLSEAFAPSLVKKASLEAFPLKPPRHHNFDNQIQISLRQPSRFKFWVKYTKLGGGLDVIEQVGRCVGVWGPEGSLLYCFCLFVCLFVLLNKFAPACLWT